MQHHYPSSNLTRIIDQSLFYQCACPAQVCRSILDLRELHDYQLNCGNDSANDKSVHDAIADAACAAHAGMEQCLTNILAIEGWDLQTLSMPEALRKKPPKLL